MVHSVTKTEIINTGKLLVENLEDEARRDLISRWLAHYIAEQITIYETLKDDEKKVAEQRCFDTILTLWQHRSSLPNGQRPFESFESIFRTLDSLDPENTQPLYRVFFPEQSTEGKIPDSIGNDIQSWLDISLEIDRAARTLIRYSLEQAADYATDEKTASWIENTINLPDNEEVSILLHLVSSDTNDPDQESSEQILQGQIKALQSKIEKLDAFVEVSRTLHTTLTDELKKLSSKSKK